MHATYRHPCLIETGHRAGLEVVGSAADADRDLCQQIDQSFCQVGDRAVVRSIGMRGLRGGNTVDGLEQGHLDVIDLPGRADELLTDLQRFPPRRHTLGHSGASRSSC